MKNLRMARRAAALALVVPSIVRRRKPLRTGRARVSVDIPFEKYTLPTV